MAAKESGEKLIALNKKARHLYEFLEKFDETHPFTQAYIDGNICMANNFRVKIPHKKTSFAIATDEKYAQIFINSCSKLGVPVLPGFNLVSLQRRFHRAKLYALVMSLISLCLVLKDHEGGEGINGAGVKNAANLNDVYNELKNCPTNTLLEKRVVELVTDMYEDGII